MADEDKKRHEKQVAERAKKGYFILEDKSKSTDPANAKLFKAKKKDSDDNSQPDDLQPKKPLSGFMFFSKDYGKTLREKASDKSVGVIQQQVGEKWGEMTDKEKAPYRKVNEEDKLRYAKQLAEIEKKGYFMMPDGSKSTDTQNIPKKRRSKLNKIQEVNESKRLTVKQGKEVLAKAKANKK